MPFNAVDQGVKGGNSFGQNTRSIRWEEEDGRG